MEKDKHRKPEMWALSIDVWKQSASVTSWLVDTISGLHDADGEPLPETARQFLLDLLFLKAKTKNKTHRYLPKSRIAERYKELLFWEQVADKESRPHGESPASLARKRVAREFKTTESNVEQIVKREARKKKLSRDK